MNVKIINNLSIEEYNSKYKNYLFLLSKFSKQDVENFYNKYLSYCNEKNLKLSKQFLLEGKSWCLINDIYYEIPNEELLKIKKFKKRTFKFKNVKYGLTLGEYYNKYCKGKNFDLVSYSKKEVDLFDKQFCLFFYNGEQFDLTYNKNYLLKDSKWCYIDGTYYEIPSKSTKKVKKKKASKPQQVKIVKPTKEKVIYTKDNIVYGLTLEEYKHKYCRKKKYLLCSYSKSDVEAFDKHYCLYSYKGQKYDLTQNKNYLLKDSKWCFINEVYYEIPTRSTPKFKHGIVEENSKAKEIKAEEINKVNDIKVEETNIEKDIKVEETKAVKEIEEPKNVVLKHTKKKYIEIEGNIIYGLSLEEYKRKYCRKNKYLLCSYSKSDVEAFDKHYCLYLYKGEKYDLNYNRNYLLKDSKWCYINGTYYEIPSRSTPKFKNIRLEEVNKVKDIKVEETKIVKEIEQPQQKVVEPIKNKSTEIKGNIEYGLTLEEYNRKYRKRLHKLLKYEKNKINGFDNEYCQYEFNDKLYYLKYNKKYLLKNRKWCYIDETYYEKPSGLYLTIKRMKAPVKVAFALLILSAVTYGTLRGLNVITHTTPTYTVSFDCGEGTIDSEHIKKIDGKTVIEVAPNAKRNGYILDGWWKTREVVNSEYIFKDKITFPYTLNSNSTMYAKWNVDYSCTHEIKFDTKGGTKLNPININGGSKFKDFTFEKPIKEDYKFLNWCYDSELSKNINENDIIDRDMTLYSKYEQVAWDVPLYTDGSQPSGTEGVSSPYTLKHCSKLETEPQTNKNNMSFMGWKDKNDNYITYPYDIKTHLNDLPLKAEFSNAYQEYTITFNPNYEGAKEFTYKCSHISAPPTVKRENYQFDGWYDENNNKIEFSIPGGYRVRKDQELFAHWKQIAFDVSVYAVKYDRETKQDPVLLETIKNCSTINTKPTNTVADYELFDWYSDEKLETKISFPYEIDSNKTKIYGRYERNAFNVVFKDGDTTLLTIENAVVLKKEQAPFIEKINHELKWTINDEEVNLDGLKVKEKIGANKELIIKTKWVRKAYSLTLNYNDGTGPIVVPVALIDGKAEISLSEIKKYKYNRTDYKCLGWSYDSFDKTSQTIIDETTVSKIELSKDTNLYCVYKKEAYSLTLNFTDYGTKTLKLKDSITVDHVSIGDHKVDELAKDETITYESKQYKFVQWTKENGDVLTDDNFKVDGNMKLYANYSIPYTLTVKYVGTPTTIADVTYNNVTRTIFNSLSNPLVEDYEIVKWTINDEEVDGSKPYILKSDTTVVAHYEKTSFTVSFYDEDTTTQLQLMNHVKTGTIIYNTDIKTPTKESKTFDAWYEEGSTSPTIFKSGYKVTKNVKFIAHYVDISSTITFTITDDDYNNGATFSKDGESDKQSVACTGSKIYSTAYNDLGYNLNYKNHALEGWYANYDSTTKTYSNKITFPIQSGTYSVYAKFLPLTEYASLQLNSGLGKFHKGEASETEALLYTVEIGSTIGDLKKRKDYVVPTLDSIYEFKNWQLYDSSKKAYTDLDDSYTFTGNIFLYAKYVENVTPPEPSSAKFKTDEWAVIGKIAEDGVTNASGTKIYGLEALKYIYSNDLKDGKFIGLTRTVTYNDTSLDVVVIDEEVDILSSDNTKKASLTFQFVDCPINYVFANASAVNAVNMWRESEMRLKCNAIKTEATTVKGDVYSNMPLQLQNHVKTVKKATMTGGKGTAAEKKELSYTDDQFFALSLNELGLTYPSEWGESNIEGSTYEYFSNGGSLIRKNSSKTATSYYVRTPINVKITSGPNEGAPINSITTTGAILTTSGQLYVDQIRGYALGFCI